MRLTWAMKGRQVLRDKESFKVLWKQLRGSGFPDVHKIKPAGTLQNAIRGLANIEVVADQWPDWKSFVIRPREPDLMPNMFGYPHWYCPYGPPDRLRELIKQDDVINWGRETMFIGLCERRLDVVMREAESRGGHVEPGSKVVTKMIDMAKVDSFNTSLPTGFTFDDLRFDEIEQVMKVWQYWKGTEQQMAALRECYYLYPHMVVRDTEGAIVCNVTVYFYGYLAAGSTRPDQRGKGIMMILLKAFVKRFPHFYNPWFGWIAETNKASLRSTEKIFVPLEGAPFLYSCPVYTPKVKGHL